MNINKLILSFLVATSFVGGVFASEQALKKTTDAAIPVLTDFIMNLQFPQLIKITKALLKPDLDLLKKKQEEGIITKEEYNSLKKLFIENNYAIYSALMKAQVNK